MVAIKEESHEQSNNQFNNHDLYFDFQSTRRRG